mmetsp:Transcript_13970/g.34101  ORF Transcript_13970/g.34101 Transcript_13970/m.34101 type:complete len:268 (+) Transcript_13970:2017-2820(+)
MFPDLTKSGEPLPGRPLNHWLFCPPIVWIPVLVLSLLHQQPIPLQSIADSPRTLAMNMEPNKTAVRGVCVESAIVLNKRAQRKFKLLSNLEVFHSVCRSDVDQARAVLRGNVVPWEDRTTSIVQIQWVLILRAFEIGSFKGSQNCKVQPGLLCNPLYEILCDDENFANRFFLIPLLPFLLLSFRGPHSARIRKILPETHRLVCRESPRCGGPDQHVRNEVLCSRGERRGREHPRQGRGLRDNSQRDVHGGRNMVVNILEFGLGQCSL